MWLGKYVLVAMLGNYTVVKAARRLVLRAMRQLKLSDMSLRRYAVMDVQKSIQPLAACKSGKQAHAVAWFCSGYTECHFIGWQNCKVYIPYR